MGASLVDQYQRQARWRRWSEALALLPLERGGFSHAREDRVETVLRWRDRDEACAAVFDGGPGALPFSMFDDEQKREVCDEFVASIEPYRRGTSFEVPAEFVYASARLPSTPP